MTRVIEFVRADRQDVCYLYVGDHVAFPGWYAALVLYWKRSQTEAVLSAKHFSSSQQIDDVEAQARQWITSELGMNSPIERTVREYVVADE